MLDEIDRDEQTTLAGSEARRGRGGLVHVKTAAERSVVALAKRMKTQRYLSDAGVKIGKRSRVKR